MSFQAIAAEIKASNINCVGCSRVEIAEESHKRNLSIPQAYVDFLTICGKESEHVFCGCHVELAAWDYINEGGRESYKAVYGHDCPADIFFIMEHHGYSYYYFHLSEGENPDIYLFVHGDEITNERIGKLDEVLRLEVERLK